MAIRRSVFLILALAHQQIQMLGQRLVFVGDLLAQCSAHRLFVSLELGTLTVKSILGDLFTCLMLQSPIGSFGRFQLRQ